MLRFRSRRSYFLRRSLVPGAVSLAAVAVLLAVILAGCVIMLLTPVYRVSGCSMEPTLHDGDIIFLRRGESPAAGDVCCFFREGKVYVKRVIALGGSTVDMDEAGNVTVDCCALQEQYVAFPQPGPTERSFPCVVPEENCFVMGDNRAASLDSRSRTVGFVPTEEIIGRVSRVIHTHG